MSVRGWGVLCVYLRFPLKDDHSASFVPCGKELASVVKLNSGDYIGWGRERAERQRWRQAEEERGRGWERTVKTERENWTIS